MKKTESTIMQPRFKGYCFFCGSPNVNGEHHLLFGNGMRKPAEEDGIKADVCERCHVTGEVIRRIHDNPMAELLSKMLGQALYERNECAKGATLDDAREKFRKRYGRSYW